jgi:hypothetical protein
MCLLRAQGVKALDTLDIEKMPRSRPLIQYQIRLCAAVAVAE